MERLFEKLAQWRSASILALGLSLLPAVAAPALADDPCTLDNKPAATLLLPYFEVDPLNPSGMTTVFSVNNSSPAAVMAHVVLWTDLGIPTLSYDVYLTGYDVQTFNLRDILMAGAIPQTASAGQDPSDTISPKGQYSQDLNFASCTGVLPLPQLPASILTHLRAAHSGQFSAILNGCAGQNLGDGRLRGYVTVDAANGCSLKFPTDPGYFVAGGQGIASNQNVLWGDYFYLDSSNSYADGENLVRIKALAAAPAAGQPTFYGRYVNGSGIDGRQALPTTWMSRYVNGGAFSGGTDVVVWRESEPGVAPFACGAQPAGYPLRMGQEVTFDEEEHPVTRHVYPQIGPDPLPADTLFPAAANKVQVNGAALPVPYNFGWLFLDLNRPGVAAREVRQSWVTTVMKAQGRFSVGVSATPLDSACAPVPSIVP